MAESENENKHDTDGNETSAADTRTESAGTDATPADALSSESRSGGQRGWWLLAGITVVSLILLHCFGSEEDRYRKAHELEERWHDAKARLILRLGERLAEDESKRLTAPSDEVVLSGIVDSYRKALGIMYGKTAAELGPIPVGSGVVPPVRPQVLEKQLHSEIQKLQAVCKISTTGEKVASSSKGQSECQAAVGKAVKNFLQQVDYTYHRHGELETAQALSRFREQVATALARYFADTFPRHGSAPQLVTDYRNALDKLFDENPTGVTQQRGAEGSAPDWWSSFIGRTETSLFSESGGLHPAYRLLVALLNLVVALAFFSVLYLIIRNGPDPLKTWAEEVGAMLEKLTHSIGDAGDGAAKTLSSLALVGGIAAVPIYATYKAMPPSQGDNDTHENSSVSRSFDTQFRFEKVLAELNVLKTEIETKVKTTSEQPPQGPKSPPVPWDIHVGFDKILIEGPSKGKGMMLAAELLKDSAQHLDSAAASLNNSGSQAVAVAKYNALAMGVLGIHVDELGKQTSESGARAEASADRQENFMEVVLPKLAASADLLRNVVVTERAEQSLFCGKFTTLLKNQVKDKDKDSKSQWVPFEGLFQEIGLQFHGNNKAEESFCRVAKELCEIEARRRTIEKTEALGDCPKPEPAVQQKPEACGSG